MSLIVVDLCSLLNECNCFCVYLVNSDKQESISANIKSFIRKSFQSSVIP